MNREQRRQIVKKLETKGYAQHDIENILQLKQILDTKRNFREGDKVRLDVAQMMSRKDWPRSVEKYKHWVQTNEGRVFTVEYSDKKSHSHSLVSLAEDTTVPKWLIWEGDLIPVSDATLREQPADLNNQN